MQGADVREETNESPLTSSLDRPPTAAFHFPLTL